MSISISWEGNRWSRIALAIQTYRLNGLVTSHSTSLKIAPFHTDYEFLLAFHPNYGLFV